MSESGQLITASDLMRAKPRRYATVEIPTLGTVRLQSLTERERMRWETQQYDSRGRVDPKLVELQRCALIGLCLVDANGAKILSTGEAERLADECDATVIDVLFEACKDHLNTFGRDSLKKKSDD